MVEEAADRSSPPRVLGIEGTAWAASAAVYDAGEGEIRMETDPYVPETGGLHPRDAAEHMQEALPQVVEEVLDSMAAPPDAVAFSRGPGLGPCLRIVGTTARALSLSLDVPLVGVNHMVAHLEVGRHESGFADPVGLNASGANAHVLGYRDGRYRILGETMDTGVGNAIDKFARHVGWSHPGGPKVERAAADGTYRELPYVVKGMDFSFSGIASAAQEAVDPSLDDPPPDPDDVGGRLADVCFSLQETVFAMLVEVAERALSLTGRDELVLGGGVGQNARLREMLETMCEAREARFFAPEARFLRDNAGMIALLGAEMLEAGDTVDVADSWVLPDYRPDQVAVTWRSDCGDPPSRRGSAALHGAEALVAVEESTVEKRRRPKPYRHPALDERLRRERTAAEARLTAAARRLGVPTPVVLDVDLREATIRFERVGIADLRDAVSEAGVRALGDHLATIHTAGIVHGDPTTRNVRVVEASRPSEDPAARSGGPAGRVFLIDFGLGFYSRDVEDFAMDLHVAGQSLAGTADDAPALTAALRDAYADAGEPAVMARLRDIEGRGRYQSGVATGSDRAGEG